MFTTQSSLVRSLAASFLACLSAGCASHSMRPASFESLRPTREIRYVEPGEWSRENGFLSNIIPEGTSEEDLEIMRDGVGVALGLFPEPVCTDMEAECEASFEGLGAPAIVFRAQEKDGVVHSMYAVAMCANGVILWRLDRGEWQPLQAFKTAVAPGVPHVLHVKALGGTIRAVLDGQPVFAREDFVLSSAGLVGLCAWQGPCRFLSFRVAKRD